MDLNRFELFKNETDSMINSLFKNLSSGEIKKNSHKLNQIYIQVNSYLDTIEENKKNILNFIKFKDICSFNEKNSDFDLKTLGSFDKKTNYTDSKNEIYFSSKLILKSFYNPIIALSHLANCIWFLFNHK